MKKYLKLSIVLSFALFNFLSFSNIVQAADVPPVIRVGLEYKYKNASKIDINNHEILMGYDLKGGFVPETIFKSNTGFNVVPSYSYYVGYNQSLDTYEEAILLAQELESYGINAFPVSSYTSKWYVYLGEFSTYNETENACSALGGLTDMNFIVKEPRPFRTVLKSQSGVLAIFEGEEAYPQFCGIDNYSLQEIIDLGDRQYRGRIEFGRYDGNGITAVNVIPFEEYLYGVVPSEMPSSWDMEALKAQAIVARNYAINCMGKHNNVGYDLCDGEHCQVYKGYGTETESTNRAVDETRGEILYYDNELVSTFYFASSGGYTENSENVWIASLPYLKAVQDSYEQAPHIWTKSFSRQDVETLLRNNGKDIGKVVDIQVGGYTSGGRVMEIAIIGTNGSESITKESIRTFFKTNGASLESRNFELIKGGTSNNTSLSIIGGNYNINQNALINQIYVLGADGNITNLSYNNSSINVHGKNGGEILSLTPSTPVSGDFVFQGKGKGHGVGMSQWGAKGMAEAGYDCREILSHYFNGAQVR